MQGHEHGQGFDLWVIGMDCPSQSLDNFVLESLYLQGNNFCNGLFFVQPKIYKTDDHDIDPTLIDADAINVIHRLREAGFIAYLVGGSVRDLLVKKKPKDFDISTSAKPEEIKHIFQRSCLLIGRRFRLAHLRFGHKILEVSTFRSGENDNDLIVHDNLWGSPEEDVLRRDFTINGLFYDPSSHTIIDYVGGWEDIHKHVLRTIGEPVARFRQDPVRMIRLLKFRARFGFEVDPRTMSALGRCLEEIVKSSPARILEEVLRMLESGASEPFFRLMTGSGLLDLLFPCLNYFLEGKHGEDVYKLLSVADEINLEGGKRILDRALLTACLLFPILDREIHSKFLNHNIIPNFGQIIALTSTLVHSVVTSSFSHFPKRLSMLANYILATQYRLVPLAGKRPHRSKFMHNKEFDLALQFLKIRALADKNLMEEYLWWDNIHRQEEKGSRGHHPSSHHAG